MRSYRISAQKLVDRYCVANNSLITSQRRCESALRDLRLARKLITRRERESRLTFDDFSLNVEFGSSNAENSRVSRKTTPFVALEWRRLDTSPAEQLKPAVISHRGDLKFQLKLNREARVDGRLTSSSCAPLRPKARLGFNTQFEFPPGQEVSPAHKRFSATFANVCEGIILANGTRQSVNGFSKAVGHRHPGRCDLPTNGDPATKSAAEITTVRKLQGE
ncbi:hypothetical protein K0M31_005866 [Melipona bicolor]|uniref:Uncharacterized protein n=1 Tax=Melipona bicolor TaxID=60889 RepID=A0AA40FUE2_9HYME|nr:hypothetical protein K0M31_005866 [Melipona bicolor]